MFHDEFSSNLETLDGHANMKAYIGACKSFNTLIDRNADFADVLIRYQILKGLYRFLSSKSKHLLHRHIQVLRGRKARDILQLLFQANHDTANDCTLAQRQCSNIRHLILRAACKESNDRDVSAISHSINALSDCACTAVLKDVVCAISVGDLEDLLRPVGSGLVVDGVVGTVGLLDLSELGVR